jgi:hypothetical protein
VACEVVRDVGFFLDDLGMSSLEGVVFLYSVVLVGVISCYKHDVMILVVE